MTNEPKQYKIEDWTDVEHCVFHALTDPPADNTTHRIAHVISCLADVLVETGTITEKAVEEILLTCRRSFP
jgi:hypothetical protein